MAARRHGVADGAGTWRRGIGKEVACNGGERTVLCVRRLTDRVHECLRLQWWSVANPSVARAVMATTSINARLGELG